MTTIPAPSDLPDPAPAPTLLLTRPEEASRAFVARLGDWPGPVIHAPLLEIVALDAAPPVPSPRALIFTSAAALRAYRGPRDLPAFCVGAATTEAARERGLDAEMLGPDAATLVDALPGRAPPQPLAHVRGLHVALPVSERLAEAGLRCVDWVVYDQEARDLDAAARRALARAAVVVLPVFSPRSAGLLCAALLAAPPHAACRFVAISPAVADRVRADLPGAEVVVAERPDAEAMARAVHASARPAPALEGRRPLP